MEFQDFGILLCFFVRGLWISGSDMPRVDIKSSLLHRILDKVPVNAPASQDVFAQNSSMQYAFGGSLLNYSIMAPKPYSNY